MADVSFIKIKNLADCNLDAHLQPNLFYSFRWLDVLMREYNFDFYKAQSVNDNCFLICAVISQFGFRKTVSLPFCDYSTPSIKNTSKLYELISACENKFNKFPVVFTLKLPTQMNVKSIDYSLKHSAYCHTVDTSNGLKEVENNMDNSFLRGIRKAKEHGLNISFVNSKEALKKFYEMYSRQRTRKFGKLPQPFSFFEKIWQHFLRENHGFILQAQKDSTVIASLFILEHHQKLYYKFGCSNPDYLDYRPNNLLFYSLFTHAAEQGFDRVDLGLSGISESYAGLVRFKEYMGGVAENIYTLRINPENYNAGIEKEISDFTNSTTEMIVSQNPDATTADKYSQILYSYFA